MVTQPNRTLRDKVDALFHPDEKAERELTAQNQRFEQADNTATEVKSAPLVIEGHTQHLNYRPVEGVADMNADAQGKLFDANYGTKADGDPKVVQKSAFEKIKAAGDKLLERYRVTAAEFNIANMRELGNPAAIVNFDSRKIFDRTEIDKFIDLNPERAGRWEAGALKSDLDDNIKKLFEGIYGATLSNHIDALMADRIAVGGGNSALLHDLIRDMIDKNNPIGPITTEEEIAKMLSDTIKITLLRDPSKAGDVINKIATNGRIDLIGIDSFVTTLKERTILHIVDRFANADPQNFNVGAPANAPLAAEVRANRQQLIQQLTTAPGGHTLNLSFVHGGIVSPGLSFTQLDHINTNLHANLLGGATLNLDARPAGPGHPGAAAINGYKTDAYRGIAERFVTGVLGNAAKAMANEMSIIMTTNPAEAKRVFDAIMTGALTLGCDTTKTKLDRLSGFAGALKIMRECRAAGVTGTNNIETTLEGIATPDKIMENTQRELLTGIIVRIEAAVPAIAGLLAGELQLAVDQALQGKHLDIQLIERLSMLAAGVTDPGSRKEILSGLRAISSLEVIREVAIRAAGSDSDPKYQQYLMALMNRFVFADSGVAGGAAVTPEQLTQQLFELLYAKTNAEEALSLNINGLAPLKNYLQALLPGGTAIEASLKMNGVASGKDPATRDIYVKAHELFGIIRRGSEAGEMNALVGATDAQQEAYLIANYGLTPGSPELTAALGRFKEVLAAVPVVVPPNTSLHIPELIDAAAGNTPTNYGLRYTNMMRMLRNYIENGGDLAETMRNSENLQVNDFIKSIQSQANAQTGAAAGGVLTNANRVLTVEEQRLAVLQNYDQLTLRNGLGGWIDRIKTVGPRIMKGLGFMALGLAGAMVPAIAGPLAIGFAVLRIASVVGIVKTGVPLIKKAWAEKDWKSGLAAGLAIGVNSFVNIAIPSPFSSGLLLITEALGVELYTDRKLLKETKLIVDAHATYEAALQNKIATLNNANPADVAFITKLARSINVTPVAPGGIVDIVATSALIFAPGGARATARTAQNMTLLRSFSQVVEEEMKPNVTLLNNANMKARKMYDETQQTVMAYSLASSATKLGFGIGRGFAQGLGRAGILGGIAGAFGWAVGGAESKDNSSNPDGKVEHAENWNQVHTKLEGDFDRQAQQLGIEHSGNNVVGLMEDNTGHHFALVDLDGNPKTVETLVGVNSLDVSHPGTATLDFGHQSLGSVSATDTNTFREQIALATGNNMNNVTLSTPPAGSNPSIVSVAHVNGSSFALVNDSTGAHIYQATVTESVNHIPGSPTTTPIETGGGQGGLESIYNIADDNGSQWSLIENTLRVAYPGLSDQQYYTATANMINEAGTGKVYEHIYDNRGLGVVHAHAVQTGDKLTLADIKEMAPKNFERIEQASGVTHSTDSAPQVTISNPIGGDGSVETQTSLNLVGQPLNQGIPNPVAVMVFDPSGAVLANGTFTTSSDDSTGGTGDNTGGGTPQQPTHQGNWFTNQWAQFTAALSHDANVNTQTNETGTGGGNTEAVSNDTFTLKDPGLGRNIPIFEDTISKIVIPAASGFEGAPAHVIDPRTVDIISVDPHHGVTYIDANGEKVFAPATNGVQFEFVGNENQLVDAASGQQTILTNVNSAVHYIESGVGSIQQTTHTISTGLNETNQHLTGIANDATTTVAGVNENASDTADIISATGHPVYDPGFTNEASAILSHTGVVDGNQGFMTSTHLPAWLESVAITSPDGNHVVHLEDVTKMGETYIEYRDINTNQIVRYEGSNVMGVGFVQGTNQTLTFDFQPTDPTNPIIQPVSNPWWASLVTPQ